MKISNRFKKLRIRHIGYVFLIMMIMNVAITNILRIAGFTITYSNPTRVFIIIQIFAVAVLAWVLGWVSGHESCLEHLKDDEEE